jgi:nitroreductase
MTTIQATQETFRRAVVGATLAPSVHNTQPWRFVLRPGVLDVYADRGRQRSCCISDVMGPPVLRVTPG